MLVTVDIEELRVGMFVHLDLGWWAHPFALSSFLVTSPDQIATLRGLGLRKLRWSPDKSRLPPEPDSPDEPHPDEASAQAEADAHAAADESGPQAVHRAALAAQRAAQRLCEAQYGEAGAAWSEAQREIRPRPELARSITEGLTQALLDKLMVDREMCVRVLAEVGDDRVTGHALNVAVISLLMGRVFGFSADEMLDMGVGALLHDVGKIDLPERVRHADSRIDSHDLVLYRSHVELGVAQGRRMRLSEGALQVLAQHHETADGNGFPARLNLDRMAAASRIVSLVNRYDNLCNPLHPAQALTPHEALSLIFAQSRAQYDATMLNAFIRMMGVYPPGSVVQLTDDRYATVVSCNSSRPLKPRVLVCDPTVPVVEALLLDLDKHTDLGIRRSLKPSLLPGFARDYLSPRERMVYFFEPVGVVHDPAPLGLAA